MITRTIFRILGLTGLVVSLFFLSCADDLEEEPWRYEESFNSYGYCFYGKDCNEVTYVTESQCKKEGGNFYTSESGCQSNNSGYCLHNNNCSSMSQFTCSNYYGSSFYTALSSCLLNVSDTSSLEVVYGPGPDVEYGGEIYNTVAIGSQTWFARNLNYATSSGSWCYDCFSYGRLYDWAAAMGFPSACNSNSVGSSSCNVQINSKHQGICPSGWHIPSSAEWTTLENAIGGSFTAGTKLRSQTGWHGCGPSGSGYYYICEDAYGFSALPGGLRDYGGADNYNGVGNYGYWWSATEYGASIAYNHHMYYDNSYSGRLNKSSGFSVRCVQ